MGALAMCDRSCNHGLGAGGAFDLSLQLASADLFVGTTDVGGFAMPNVCMDKH